MSKKLDCKIKRLRNLKISIIIIVTLIFVLSLGCEKAPVIEQQEEKGQEPVPSETKETAPQTTQEETPPVVEETPEEIEWEGVTFSPIEGLRFDKGTFYFLDGNPYGGEVGEKAGVLIPRDAVEINGIGVAAFGFGPKVLEVMQKKIMEEEKEFRYPLPFNLEEAKGIKIREVADTESDEWAKSKGYFWDNNTYLEISNVPIGTIIYSPVNSKEYLIWDNNLGRNDLQESSWFQLYFSRVTPEEYKGKLIFKKERVDVTELSIEFGGVNLLPSGIEENISLNEIGGYSFLTEINFGEPIAEVVPKSDSSSLDKTGNNSGLSSIEINYVIYQLKDKNGKEFSTISALFNMNEEWPPDTSNISKLSNLGLEGLLEKESIPVFIKPTL